ncbi:alpha/beta hydrolase [Actinomycetospora chiangmaiensis]|uniref:alpha/beta hydrolase n=1 Tax=Actinomycetospora chiangmaiensis TaxID=402650 RepID=UPI0003785E64|nr:alpha/beta hydrolase-fold protein [Actinomycetospora chiangmaiensis]
MSSRTTPVVGNLRPLLGVLTGAVAVLTVVLLVAAGGDPRDVPVTDWPFHALLAALLVLAVVAAAAARRRGTRVTAVLVTVVVLLLNLAAAVNTYVDYDRTLGAVLGVEPADEESLARLLRQTTVPTHGEIAAVTIPTRRSGFAARQALVYVPPAWFHRPRPRLPVVVLLHGTPGTPSDWFGPGLAAATADAFAAAHGGTAPILVAPDINGTEDADTECVDSPLGRVETALTADLPAFVTATFRTQPTGRAWAVAGLSEGGSCAMMLALRHPTLFETFGNYAGLAGPRVGETNADTAPTVGGLFGGSEQAFRAHEPSSLLTTRRFPRLGGWWEVGDADSEPAAAQQALVPLARRSGTTVCSVVIPDGGHTFDVFSAGFADSLPWMAARLGIPSTGVSCPQQ